MPISWGVGEISRVPLPVILPVGKEAEDLTAKLMGSPSGSVPLRGSLNVSPTLMLMVSIAARLGA